MSDGEVTQAAEVPSDAARASLPFYEGPLDLLLHLIKAAELDPHDVTTSQITEQYLGYVEMLGQLNLDIAGEYLVMAATLLLIKSFALLPHANGGDQAEVEDLRARPGRAAARISALSRGRRQTRRARASSAATCSRRRASQSLPMTKALRRSSPCRSSI